MQAKHIILGIHIGNRLTTAATVQQLLTEYGINIKTRLGLHDADGSSSARTGVLLLELVGAENRCYELADKLGSVAGIEVQKIVFDHP